MHTVDAVNSVDAVGTVDAVNTVNAMNIVSVDLFAPTPTASTAWGVQ